MRALRAASDFPAARVARPRSSRRIVVQGRFSAIRGVLPQEADRAT
jgi:hypothetical protein